MVENHSFVSPWQSVKSAYVRKFETAKKEHTKRTRHEKKKSRSHQKLSSKNSLADQLTVCLPLALFFSCDLSFSSKFSELRCNLQPGVYDMRLHILYSILLYSDPEISRERITSRCRAQDIRRRWRPRTRRPSS